MTEGLPWRCTVNDVADPYSNGLKHDLVYSLPVDSSLRVDFSDRKSAHTSSWEPQQWSTAGESITQPRMHIEAAIQFVTDSSQVLAGEYDCVQPIGGRQWCE